MGEHERSCLVTGTAGDIGKALVDAFATKGFRVVALDIKSNPPDVAAHSYIQADLARFVSSATYAGRVVERIRTAISGTQLGVLVNNAATQIVKPVSEISRADWSQTLAVNISAPFFLTQALLPELTEAAATVVNVSSIHARLTKPDFVAYATSKGALTAMTRAMAVELGRSVRVNAVEPAAIDTAMLRAGLRRPADVRRLKNYHPTGNIGDPRHVAEAVLRLVDAPGGFMNGSVVPLDGGISGRLHDPF